VGQDVLQVGVQDGQNPEVFIIETPELVSTGFSVPWVLEVGQKFVQVFLLILGKESGVSEKAAQIHPVPFQVAVQEPLGQKFSGIEGDVLAEFSLELLFG